MAPDPADTPPSPPTLAADVLVHELYELAAALERVLGSDAIATLAPLVASAIMPIVRAADQVAQRRAAIGELEFFASTIQQFRPDSADVADVAHMARHRADMLRNGYPIKLPAPEAS